MQFRELIDGAVGHGGRELQPGDREMQAWWRSYR